MTHWFALQRIISAKVGSRPIRLLNTCVHTLTETRAKSGITLGILAGGRACRLAGIDKAWLECDGTPQVLRWQRRFLDEVDATLVSANRSLMRYQQANLDTVPDLYLDQGPLAGLHALADACTTTWLLTLPVDLVEVGNELLPMLQAGVGKHGAFACDDDGPQPLVALWNVAVLRPAVTRALNSDELAVHTLQSRIGMAAVRFSGMRFGNLNTPNDLVEAGIDLQ